jgi:FlaA1/EpsC-like NDP-sugar epimerase
MSKSEIARSDSGLADGWNVGRVLVVALFQKSAVDNVVAAGVMRWKRLNPSAAWTSVNLASPRLTSESVGRMLVLALRRQDMKADQLIIIGAGSVGRLALELVLQGDLACAGILAIDVDCSPLRKDIAATTSAIRLVVHEAECETSAGDLLVNLRAADVDERIMMLRSVDEDPAATARAAETFLLELVAIGSRQRSNKVRAFHD